MNKAIEKLIQSRLFIFFIQVLALTLAIAAFNHHFSISFDKGITPERQQIIQFLSNYVSVNFYTSNVLFTYISWLIVSLIPTFIFQNYKKAYSTNLTTFFFPNFFFYVFLSRYSPDFFEANFTTLLINTIFLAIIITLFSIGMSLILHKLTEENIESQQADLNRIKEKIQSTCPHCGTKYESSPLFCYNCLKKMTIEPESENE